MDPQRLDNQLCFPLYSASKLVVASYTPFLEPFELTYTQYIVMLVLWEKRSITMAELGKILHLDSGTLTPLTNKLIQKSLIKKEMDKYDRRKVNLVLTIKGKRLKEKMEDIPSKVGNCFPLELNEAIALRKLLDKVIEGYEQ